MSSSFQSEPDVEPSTPRGAATGRAAPNSSNFQQRSKKGYSEKGGLRSSRESDSPSQSGEHNSFAGNNRDSRNIGTIMPSKFI